MAVLDAAELRRVLAEYLSGTKTLGELEDWLLWYVSDERLLQAGPAVQALWTELDGRMDQLAEGLITEEQFKAWVQPLAQPGVVHVRSIRPEVVAEGEGLLWIGDRRARELTSRAQSAAEVVFKPTEVQV
jgi:hypothetical protein